MKHLMALKYLKLMSQVKANVFWESNKNRKERK